MGTRRHRPSESAIVSPLTRATSISPACGHAIGTDPWPYARGSRGGTQQALDTPVPGRWAALRGQAGGGRGQGDRAGTCFSHRCRTGGTICRQRASRLVYQHAGNLRQNQNGCPSLRRFRSSSTPRSPAGQGADRLTVRRGESFEPAVLERERARFRRRSVIATATTTTMIAAESAASSCLPVLAAAPNAHGDLSCLCAVRSHLRVNALLVDYGRIGG